MEKLIKAAFCSLLGTGMMTLSSALMSVKGQEFREPKHLSKLTGRLLPFLLKETVTAIGWMGHYGMGLVFSYAYVELWDKGKLRDSYKNGAILGGLSGIIGMAIWKATFRIHPFSPSMNYNRFYLQRLPAHLVFAIFATMAYRLMKAKRSREKLVTTTNPRSAEQLFSSERPVTPV